ncbi:MAG: hypothetical protein Q8M01_15315 [Rubrivivax sp.]|nr:hypothetical protein [Rubrivivax sp.]
MNDTTYTGAAALQRLLQGLFDVSNATCGSDDASDARDYRLLAKMVKNSIAQNLQHQDSAHREGYLRALTDLFCMAADGCCPSAGWDPIANTAAAFAAPICDMEAQP